MLCSLKSTRVLQYNVYKLLGDLRLTIFVNTRSHDYFNMFKSNSVSSQNTYFAVNRDKRSHFVCYGECYFSMSYTLFNIPPLWMQTLERLLLFMLNYQQREVFRRMGTGREIVRLFNRGNYNIWDSLYDITHHNYK